MADVVIRPFFVPGSAAIHRLETAASIVKSRAPENAAADFVLAYAAMAQDDAERALRHLHDGNARGTFEAYARERFHAMVQAGDALGADPAIVRSYSFGSLVPVHVLHAVQQTCRWLRKDVASEAARAECLAAGRLIDRDAHTLLESMFAVSLQREAVEGTSGRAWRQDRRRVAERSRVLGKLFRVYVGRALPALPPAEFYEAVLSSGEEHFAVGRICARRASGRLCTTLAGA
jgi:hypothetical protein